jgi:hypothetical protein
LKIQRLFGFENILPWEEEQGSRKNESGRYEPVFDVLTMVGSEYGHGNGWLSRCLRSSEGTEGTNGTRVQNVDFTLLG